MSRQIQIRASAEQRSEIEALLKLPSQAVSPRPRTRLIAFQKLILGGSHGRIAQESGITNEALRKIRKEIDEKGLDDLLGKMRAAAAKRLSLATTAGRRPGAPRAESLRKTISA